jgi:D-beta-D-heptose 7-phosphate kinase/D-beta-D-heptose 1-phosphate adenosyltransferase
MEFTLNLATKPRIVVLGDIFLDHTFYGSVTRIANEAPVPVYKQTHDVWTLGGAGNVLANLASMGCSDLYAFGRIGADEPYKSKIESLLSQYKINNNLLINTALNVVKNRYYCGKTLLFRHDYESQAFISEKEEDAVIQTLRELCSGSKIDCIVFSDYNKGFLTTRLCQAVISMAREKSIFTVVDPKEDYTKYIGCSLLKPNRNETFKLFGIQVEGIDTKHAHQYIHEKVGCEASVITLSEHGATLCNQSEEIIHRANQPMEVIDVTGAGDIVCATLAYLYPIYENKQHIIEIANVFAMISVGHLSTYVLQPYDFVKSRGILSKSLQRTKCIDPANLRRIIDIMSTNTTVFTNGCFDIIHVGHLDLLKRCREMGDIVIVGLNSDASISRLKGPERPIMNLEKRVAFLSALEYVDYIVVFEEDTPAEVLAQLKPSMLVKGADYKPEQLPGREHVKEVRIVPLMEGYSSTSVIRTIRDRT